MRPNKDITTSQMTIKWKIYIFAAYLIFILHWSKKSFETSYFSRFSLSLPLFFLRHLTHSDYLLLELLFVRRRAF